MKYLIFLGLLLPIFTNAQVSFVQQTVYKNQLSLQSGLQPALGWNLSYLRQANIPGLDWQNAYYLKAGATYTRSLKDNHEIGLGAQTLIWKHNNWGIQNDLSVTRAQLNSKLYQAKKWTLTEQLAAGLFLNKTAVLLTMAYTQTLGLHLAPSEFYQHTIYPDAKAGWYKQVGGIIAPGLSFRQLCGERFDVGVDVSMPFTTAWNALSIVPVEASVHLGFRW